jgi:hypothetical protein
VGEGANRTRTPDVLLLESLMVWNVFPLELSNSVYRKHQIPSNETVFRQ